MSATALASRLDELASDGAHISESADTIVVSNLSARSVAEVSQHLSVLMWQYDIFDHAGTPWDMSDVDEPFAPFRITVQKPTVAKCLRLLTNTAFGDWLKQDEEHSSQLQIALLGKAFDTRSVRFTPWQDAASEFNPDVGIRSPRSFVREFGSVRHAPKHIGKWIIKSEASIDLRNCSFTVWMQHASTKLLCAIPDEIDSEDGSLKFKGPPRLTLVHPTNTPDFYSEITNFGFWDLHRAVAWIFENEREAELRHILFATEIARSGSTASATGAFLNENVAQAWEGAKIAYQASLSQMGGETLKSLADLRKAVTEETAKVSETTRQIIGAVATALATGIGLLAARVTLAPENPIVAWVMIVAVLYVIIVIVSGVQFALIQRALRENWQSRLYRFIPVQEYRSLVTAPIQRAEGTLWTVATIGGVSVIVFAVVVLWHK